jgi:hypothetical protein
VPAPDANSFLTTDCHPKFPEMGKRLMKVSASLGGGCEGHLRRRRGSGGPPSTTRLGARARVWGPRAKRFTPGGVRRADLGPARESGGRVRRNLRLGEFEGQTWDPLSPQTGTFSLLSSLAARPLVCCSARTA